MKLQSTVWSGLSTGKLENYPIILEFYKLKEFMFHRKKNYSKRAFAPLFLLDFKLEKLCVADWELKQALTL